MSDVLQLLYSSGDDGEGSVDVVRVPDKGSQLKCTQIDLQGFPVYGVIDSGSNITIMGGDLLRRVASAAKLRKRDLKPPDRTPQNYDQRPFKFHGRMDLSLFCWRDALTMSVYIKMDTPEPLLLSDGVCRQLGILQYHPDGQVCSRKKRQQNMPGSIPKEKRLRNRLMG